MLECSKVSEVNNGYPLVQAHLEGANLTNTIGLSYVQLHHAYMDEKTKLPEGVRKDLENQKSN